MLLSQLGWSVFFGLYCINFRESPKFDPFTKQYKFLILFALLELINEDILMRCH